MAHVPTVTDALDRRGGTRSYQVVLSHEGLLMTQYKFAWQRPLDQITHELEKLLAGRPRLPS